MNNHKISREEILQKYPNLPKEAVDWLVSGEKGISSKTIMKTLSGYPLIADGDEYHPLDPDDFRRCRLLLEAVPGYADRIGEMAKVSIDWKVLVEAWDDICKTMDKEIPEWRKAPGEAKETAEMIRSVRAKAKNNSADLISRLLNTAFESYDFSPCVVLETDGWESEGPLSHSRIVYIEGETPDSDTERLVFHVEIKDLSLVDFDAYALDMKTGNLIGCMPASDNRSSSPSL